ncbi:hypothetical protein C8A05DRAFT_34614 [Staphylotrichum tortipilum]|uniref:Uncharacterized protein n=1 Tax=Staphylotrichum tortipilum TaxID=2831512 RepID=A0AAN6RT94_9PEZI|nr:hypothetical protein C8A05DRAFT_34614 [Staphylotrichum longicolle]
MATFKFLISFLLGLASVKAATAAAAPKVYPEVIPGPGLPSLAELNLTSAQLYEMGPPDAASVALANALAKRRPAYPLQCGRYDFEYANVDDIVACFHFIQNLGTTSCVAPGGQGQFVTMCTAGAAQVVAWSYNYQTVSSYCSDVALGLLSVIDRCTRADHTCAGSNAANGNGDFVVYADLKP